jgi:hypothetical protein
MFIFKSNLSNTHGYAYHCHILYPAVSDTVRHASSRIGDSLPVRSASLCGTPGARARSMLRSGRGVAVHPVGWPSCARATAGQAAHHCGSRPRAVSGQAPEGQFAKQAEPLGQISAGPHQANPPSKPGRWARFSP